MTELSFTKTFLSTLDSRPIKLPSDHVFDPKTFEPKGPYTLPRMPHPMRRISKPSAPGSAPALTLSLKSLRNPPLDISLSNKSVMTSVLDLKQAVAENIGVTGTDKIRLLYKKKPCADSKTIKDVIGDEVLKVVEFSVMVMGGVVTAGTAASEAEKYPGSAVDSDTTMEDISRPQDLSAARVLDAQELSGAPLLGTQQFWQDLNTFLIQRIGDKKVASDASAVFAQAWKGRDS
ncbi:hypothetical protein MMC26_003584 [Xylographa opegraphella]|nr:hypothetical protein [Xylographa opegraphella]